jgi:hypothetical protein
LFSLLFSRLFSMIAPINLGLTYPHTPLKTNVAGPVM